MDPVKILKRSWHILWSYRALWVFGLILALAAGGSSTWRVRTMEPDTNSTAENQQMPLPQDIRQGMQEFTPRNGTALR